MAHNHGSTKIIVTTEAYNVERDQDTWSFFLDKFEVWMLKAHLPLIEKQGPQWVIAQTLAVHWYSVAWHSDDHVTWIYKIDARCPHVIHCINLATIQEPPWSVCNILKFDKLIYLIPRYKFMQGTNCWLISCLDSSDMNVGTEQQHWHLSLHTLCEIYIGRLPFLP